LSGQFCISGTGKGRFFQWFTIRLGELEVLPGHQARRTAEGSSHARLEAAHAGCATPKSKPGMKGLYLKDKRFGKFYLLWREPIRHYVRI